VAVVEQTVDQAQLQVAAVQAVAVKVVHFHLAQVTHLQLHHLKETMAEQVQQAHQLLVAAVAVALTQLVLLVLQ
jgi:hypothetical protein